MVDKRKCFVILPFSKTEHHSEDYWNRHFDFYLKPIIEKSGQIEAFRSQPLRGDISSQIITDLINSDIVVADLTDYNPNVFWELGVRQSYSSCTVTIAEESTTIPFHLSHKGVLFYKGDHLVNQLFEDNFVASLTDCLVNQNAPDSPVLEAMGSRGSLYSIIHAEENKRKIQALQMELDKNKTLYNTVIQTCAENKKLNAEGKTKNKVVTTLLKTSAAEFLYINRYLDLTEDFYDDLYDYFNHIIAVNMNLENWPSKNFDEVVDWLTSYEDELLRKIFKISENLKKFN